MILDERVVIPLPYTWPAAIPFWLAFWWAFAGELPFMRRDRAPRQSDRDRGSMRVIVWLNGLSMFAAFLAAGTQPRFAMTSGRVAVYVAGIACIVAAAQLRRHCFTMLGASFTYDVRVASGQQVVERGAYRYVRHPSYSAGLLLFAGVGLALGNWISLVVSIVLPAVGYGYRIAAEERALVEALGPAYAGYMKRTRRLIPFVL